MVGKFGLGAQRWLDGKNDIAGEVGNSRDWKESGLLASPAVRVSLGACTQEKDWVCEGEFGGAQCNAHTGLCGAGDRPHVAAVSLFPGRSDRRTRQSRESRGNTSKRQRSEKTEENSNTPNIIARLLRFGRTHRASKGQPVVLPTLHSALLKFFAAKGNWALCLSFAPARR